MGAQEMCDTGTPEDPCLGCPDCKAGAAVDLFNEWRPVNDREVA